MLDKVREPFKGSRTKSIIAYVLFAIICLTFVFVGVTPDQSGGGVSSAATVNDKVIPIDDFRERVSYIESQTGGFLSKLPAAQRQFQTMQIRESAINELINYELLYQSAAKVGVLPTASATRDVIVNIPVFQENGRFTRELYDRFLVSRNTRAGQFEDRIKRDVVVGQTQNLFMAAMKTPLLVSSLQQQIADTKLEVEFLKIDSASLENGLLLSKSKIVDFMSKDENVSKMQTFYNSNKNDYADKLEVRARHILIKGNSESSLKKIKEIQAELKITDFSTLASKYSEDEGSKARGGDLNFFSSGQMVPEFEKAAFSLPLGQVSEPVKTNYGYHLIKVEEKRGGVAKTFDEVKESIAKKLLFDLEKESFLTEISSALKENRNIESLTKKMGIKWESTGEFALNATAVPKVDAPEALLAILSIKNPGQTHPQLVRSGESSYILRLKKMTQGKYVEPSDSESTSLSRSGMEALGLWAEDLRKEARIVRNQALFK